MADMDARTEVTHLTINNPETEPAKLIITAPDGRLACAVDGEGVLTFGDGFGATEAAEAFVAAVQGMLPTAALAAADAVAVDENAALVTEIERLRRWKAEEYAEGDSTTCDERCAVCALRVVGQRLRALVAGQSDDSIEGGAS